MRYHRLCDYPHISRRTSPIAAIPHGPFVTYHVATILSSPYASRPVLLFHDKFLCSFPFAPPWDFLRIPPQAGFRINRPAVVNSVNGNLSPSNRPLISRKERVVIWATDDMSVSPPPPPHQLREREKVIGNICNQSSMRMPHKRRICNGVLIRMFLKAYPKLIFPCHQLFRLYGCARSTRDKSTGYIIYNNYSPRRERRALRSLSAVAVGYLTAHGIAKRSSSMRTRECYICYLPTSAKKCPPRSRSRLAINQKFPNDVAHRNFAAGPRGYNRESLRSLLPTARDKFRRCRKNIRLAAWAHLETTM